MTTAKFLIFAGSTRKDSYNKKLAHCAEKILRTHHAHVTFLDLAELPMPLYDGDLEATQGIPATGLKFRALLKEHDAFVICSPEYNSSISAVLKNAIDWASRPAAGEPGLIGFTGKVITLLSASVGSLGGIRGLVTLRSIFSNIGSLVLPDQLCIPFAEKAFSAAGELVDANQHKILEKICRELIKTTEKHIRD